MGVWCPACPACPHLLNQAGHPVHLLQATRAYLHAEADVEAALARNGFKVGKLTYVYLTIS